MKSAHLCLSVGVFAALLFLGACGGGGTADNAASDNGSSSSPAPTPTPTPAPEPAPTLEMEPEAVPSGAYFFSDCQSGAQIGCIPGDNANAGTSPSAPKRDLAGFNVNTLPAGAAALFARGGAWTNFHVMVKNLNATPTQPIIFGSYVPSWGGNVRPLLKVSQSVGFEFGHFNDTDNDGGYTLRNLKLDGEGVSDWGLWLRDDLRNLTVSSLDITGFAIGVHSQSGGTHGVTFFTLRNSYIHHNSDMGMLGGADDMTLDGNTFADNNFSGSGFSHGVYLGGHGRNGVVRRNTFANNSTVNGVCTGGNFTVHGQWDGLLVENNTITQTASAGGCYGISINSAYSTPEWFRNLVVRGNTIVNLGNCSICLTSAPGAIVENNLIVNTQATYHAGVAIPDRTPGAGDDIDTGAIVRNNTIFLAQPASGSEGIALGTGSGSNLQVVSNLIYYGTAANASHYCFAHTALSNYAAFANNLCHHAGGGGRWSSVYSSLADAQASGFDTSGLDSNPLFVVLPASDNHWNDQLNVGSPAVNAGHATLSSAQDRLSISRIVPDIGSREQ